MASYQALGGSGQGGDEAAGFFEPPRRQDAKEIQFYPQINAD
jgi:hypothetical protein